MLRCIMEIVAAIADQRAGNMGALIGELDWRTELAGQFEKLLNQ